MVHIDEIKINVKKYIMEQFLPGEDPEELTESTPLITGGILDSISTVKLVSFLEERFGVNFQAFEMSTEFLDTIAKISDTVSSKQV